MKQLFRYAYGRRESDADGPLLKKATEVFRDSQFRLKSLIMFLAGSLATPVPGVLKAGETACATSLDQWFAEWVGQAVSPAGAQSRKRVSTPGIPGIYRA